jgi:lantibiotic biosynthesis protein
VGSVPSKPEGTLSSRDEQPVPRGAQGPAPSVSKGPSSRRVDRGITSALRESAAPDQVRAVARLEQGREIHPEFLALRCPLLAFDDLLRWTGAGWQLAPDDPHFEQTFKAKGSLLRKHLREMLSRPDVREGLFLVTGDFFEGLHRSVGEQDSGPAQGVDVALAEQVVRLATLVEFSGLQMAPMVGEIRGGTRLSLGTASSRRSRVDIGYLAALGEAAARLPSFRSQLRFFVNSSLYRARGKVRCLTAQARGSRRDYRFMTAELTPYLETVLERAEGGASSDELVSAILTTHPEIDRSEAESYVDQLLEEQVLMPELGASLTGTDAIGDLAERLKSCPDAQGVRDALNRARHAIGQLEWEPFSGEPSRYKEIAKLLSMSSSREPLFRVQVFRSASNPSLSEAIAKDVLRGAELLASLQRPNDRIRRFTESFFARYGDEVVPLVEALDEQYGIGFEGAAIASEPLLEGLAFPSPTESNATWGQRERVLLGKLEDAWTSGSHVLLLSPEDIASIGGNNPLPLPDSFAVRGALCAMSAEALEAGDYLFRIDAVSGPPGVAAFTPFCNGDPTLEEAVTRSLRAEESLLPDATVAEIVHLPHAGDLNTAVRASFGRPEIAYLGSGSADPTHRIPVTDLRLSIVGERLRLTSERLGCEVIPRLSAPHDFLDPKNPPMYRFLCALQNQGTAAGLQWNWGPFASAAFLPRVMYGRIVLTRARWLLQGEMIQFLAQVSAVDRFRALCRLREQLLLPRFVELGTSTGDGRRRYVFDLENILSAECLIQNIRSAPAPTLVEMFPLPDALCAFGPGGRYVHELSVPFLREHSVATSSARAPRLGLQRSFAPGSEWLQVNLYSSAAVEDEVLREVVSPAIERALDSAAVDQWYFMRYTDPGFHIRLRLHGAGDRLISEVSKELRSLAEPLLEDHRIWAVKLDTYRRDLGRYGGADGALVAEEIFHADSEAVLSIVEQLSDLELNQARWQLALIGIDMLLSDLGLTRARKVEVLRTARNDIAARLRADSKLEAQIARRYQNELALLRELLGSEPEPDSPLARGISALRHRSEELKLQCAVLNELERAGRLSRSVAEQGYSYVHMFANRLFPSAGLAQELVLYDFLHRLHQE